MILKVETARILARLWSFLSFLLKMRKYNNNLQSYTQAADRVFMGATPLKVGLFLGHFFCCQPHI